ncbi:hypothetical protein LCGC14_2836250, partial [marine sediment metagenome]
MTKITVPNIREDIFKGLEGKTEVLDHSSNWATVLGEPCLRKQYYFRVEWDKQKPPDALLQGVFDTGHDIEEATIFNLNQYGLRAEPKWELMGKGLKIKDETFKRLNIGAKVDVSLMVHEGRMGKTLGPVEIKSVHPNVFHRIKAVTDLSNFWWMRRYLSQLTIYILGCNFERGFFLLVNKANHYDIQFLELRLDLDFAESLLTNATIVNAAVEFKDPPCKINDPDECDRCGFAHVCMPDLSLGKGIKIIKDPELLGNLARLEQIKPLASEYEKLKESIKKSIGKGHDCLGGNYNITWKNVKVTRKPS